jgi:hypothetical protein
LKPTELEREQKRVGRQMAEAKALIEQYQADYDSIEAALDHALLLCRYGYIAYEYAEPEVRRLLVQAAFDKLWVVGDEIVGSDLKAGYVTLLDDDLRTLLEQEANRRAEEAADEPTEGRVYNPATRGAPERPRATPPTVCRRYWRTGVSPWSGRGAASPGRKRTPPHLRQGGVRT